MTAHTKPVAEIVAEDSMDQDDSDEYLPLPPEGHPLRTLGVRLTELLDEDHWAECERLLLEGWDHDRIDRKTGADWRENSSLELWFPLTAAELTRLSEENEPPLCGCNSVLPARIIGCGNKIQNWNLVYKCTHCDTPFHKHCAEKHFRNDDVLTQEHIDSLTDEELSKINIPPRKP